MAKRATVEHKEAVPSVAFLGGGPGGRGDSDNILTPSSIIVMLTLCKHTYCLSRRTTGRHQTWWPLKPSQNESEVSAWSLTRTQTLSTQANPSQAKPRPGSGYALSIYGIAQRERAAHSHDLRPTHDLRPGAARTKTNRKKKKKKPLLCPMRNAKGQGYGGCSTCVNGTCCNRGPDVRAPGKKHFNGTVPRMSLLHHFPPSYVPCKLR